ncbi:hypothetical protein IF2G_09358 [Cordyceps javanica]|nr:hypothetical protein IF2G_09358 [Cordyceps javanica]
MAAREYKGSIQHLYFDSKSSLTPHALLMTKDAPCMCARNVMHETKIIGRPHSGNQPEWKERRNTDGFTQHRFQYINNYVHVAML